MNKTSFRGFRVMIGIMASLLVLLAQRPVLGQLPSGTILGVVKDSSGAVVAGATVTVVNTETGLTRAAMTGEDGAYRLNALPVGHYNLKVEQSGFKVVTQQGLTLEVAQEAVVNFTLEVGSSAQEVVVTGEAPLVNTTTSSLGGLVNEDKMAELPLNGRNYIELSLLQPGVMQSVVTLTGAARNGTIYSSNGAPLRSNNYLLDGAELQNLVGFNAASADGSQLGVDGIREYKVVTSNFGAEYGMSMGSQTVMVSKGGTNQFHGDAFEYLRNAAMDARNYFDYTYLRTGRRDPQYQRNNFGGSFGGPIKKDKTFFFAVYEGLREHKGIPTLNTVPGAGCHADAGATVTTAQCPQLTKTVTINSVTAPLLALYPLPNAGATGYSFAPLQPTDVDYGQIRVDHNFSPADNLFVRYTVNNGSQFVPLSYPQYTDQATNRDQYITLSENHVFSPQLLNTARLSFSRTAYTTTTLAPSLIGPNISFIPGAYTGFITVAGLTRFAPDGATPVTDNQNLWTLSDDVFYSKGKHAFKFGTLMNHFQMPIKADSQHAGQTTFSNLTNFMSNLASSFVALFPGSNTSHMWEYYTFGFYAQDDWRITQRLTLNLGLRYEFNTTAVDSTGRQTNVINLATDATPTPGPIMQNHSLKNISPRIGFAWDVFGKGKTSVRGGFGEYYDTAQIGAALALSATSIPPYAFLESVTDTPAAPITIPLSFPTCVGSCLNLQILDYHATQPHLLQWNLSVDQQLPGGVGLTVSYVGNRGLDLFSTQEGNPCTPTSITNGVPYWATACGLGRPNSNFGSIALITTSADSYYHGLQVGLTKRLSNGLEFQSSYTYSKVIDDAQSQVPADNTGVRLYAAYPYDKGPSVFDATHNWRVNVLYHFHDIKSDNSAAKLLHGWWTGNIIALQTGYPFSPNEGTLRSDSQPLTVTPSLGDRTNLVTADNVAAIRSCTYIVMGHAGGCNPNAVPFDPSTVVTGNVSQWFNPNMFILQPVGFLGDAGRDIIRGPGLFNWSFSINKDTKLPFLGENGSLQFRAEIFNILNHPNFGLPSPIVYSGSFADVTESPLSSAGAITSTNPSISGSPRDVQLALKIVF